MGGYCDYDQEMDLNDDDNDETKMEHNDISFLPSKSTMTTTTSPSSWKPTSIQILAFTALTKALLNAEYIQRYCTTSLPTFYSDDDVTPIDSLLGYDMGLGLIERHREEMTRVVQMATCYLSSIPLASLQKPSSSAAAPPPSSFSSSSTYQSNDLFCMTCMSFLSCLFRTNATEWMLVPLPSTSITKNMVIRLQHFSSKFTNTSNKNHQYSLPSSSPLSIISHVSKILAQTLLLILEWKSPTSTVPTINTTNSASATRVARSNNPEEMATILDEQSIVKIVELVFSSLPTMTSRNYSNQNRSSYSSSSSQPAITRIIQHACSVHLFIHLCLSRNECLKHVLKQTKMVSLMKESVLSAFIKATYDDYEEHHHHYGFDMTLLHCIVTYPQCRRSLYQIITDANNDEEEDIDNESSNTSGYNKLGIFLNSVLEQGKDVSFMLHCPFHGYYLFFISLPHFASYSCSFPILCIHVHRVIFFQ